MSSLFEAVEALGKFAEGLKQIQVPNVPSPSLNGTSSRLEALEQFAQDVGAYVGQIRDLELPITSVSRETLDDEMYQLENELARTREGNFQVEGADVKYVAGGIKVILPTVPDPEDVPIIDPGCFPITLAMDGGTEVSDDETKADWTYTITDAVSGDAINDSDGVALTEVHPTDGLHKWVRPARGYMTEATRGEAYRDDDGELVILWINEVADGAACG